MDQDLPTEHGAAAGGDGTAAVAAGTQRFGHPRGLATLFFTELWERFSYYGMRGILILFMAAPLVEGGLAFNDAKSAAIYGLYTAMVYLLALPGGWVADNLWGQRRAVFVGGCIIASGHFAMAMPAFGLPDQPFFFLGLILIVMGTGLLKPNVSTMVGELYPEGGARRDAGFSIFYMGINLGAFLGPLVCGALGENVDWHLGFSAAGFGMVLGLIQYRLGDKYLGKAGHLATGEDRAVVSKRSRTFYLSFAAVVGVVGLFAFLALTGVFAVTLTGVATALGYGIIALAVVYFAYLLIAGGHTTMEKRRLIVIFWLFILAAIFWSGFEQAGSSLNLFADRLTNRMIFGWEAPASWLQSINPIFIITLAPVFGWLWVWLANRKANPSIPIKFALGLLGLAAGFFVIAWGAANASAENPVSPSWLIVTYFLHTCGELCLSPVGLSSITKLAPRGRVGQMMGVWFIGAALGNLFAGLVAGRLESLAPDALFGSVALFVGAAGVVALLVSPGVRKIMGNVE